MKDNDATGAICVIALGLAFLMGPDFLEILCGSIALLVILFLYWGYRSKSKN